MPASAGTPTGTSEQMKDGASVHFIGSPRGSPLLKLPGHPRREPAKPDQGKDTECALERHPPYPPQRPGGRIDGWMDGWMDGRTVMPRSHVPLPHRAARVTVPAYPPNLFSQFIHSPPGRARGPPGQGFTAELRPGVPYTHARGSPVPCRKPATGRRGGSCPLARARRHCPGVQALWRPL